MSWDKGKHGYLSKSEKAEIILWLSQREMWDVAELAIQGLLKISEKLTVQGLQKSYKGKEDTKKR